MAEVLVVGMAVMDFVLQVPSFPEKPEKYRASDAAAVVGGCAANAAFAVARLGATARLAARLGDDAVGDLIVSDLARNGVDTALCHRTVGGRSSFSSILVDAAGERQIVNFRGEGLVDGAGWVDANADAVLADNRWPAGTHAAMAAARAAGVPGIIDAESPVEAETLAGASHVAFSRNGLKSLVGSEDIAAGLAEATARTGAVCIVTDGGNGSYLWRDGSCHHVAGFAVEVRDTLGAGDIWHGAFALRLAEAAEVTNAMRFANATAALKCREFGGRAGCPDRPTVEAFIREKTA